MISVQFEQGNASPRIVRITTTSTLAEVTTAGWYQNVPPNQLQPSDEVEIAYAQGTVNANTAIFSVSITSGVVTLSIDSSSVVLPVVSGNFANFSGTSGALADLGYLPSNAAKTNVVMLDAAPTSGHVAIFTDVAGTIGDGGVLGQAAAKAVSDNVLASVASVNGATVIDNIASFNDITGTVEDSGIAKAGVQLSANIKAATTGNIGGAGAGPISVVVAGATAASVVVPVVESSSNPVSIIAATATGTGFDVTFSADPGASALVNYILFIAPQ